MNFFKVNFLNLVIRFDQIQLNLYTRTGKIASLSPEKGVSGVDMIQYDNILYRQNGFFFEVFFTTEIIKKCRDKSTIRFNLYQNGQQ